MINNRIIFQFIILQYDRKDNVFILNPENIYQYSPILQGAR